MAEREADQGHPEDAHQQEKDQRDDAEHHLAIEAMGKSHSGANHTTSPARKLTSSAWMAGLS